MVDSKKEAILKAWLDMIIAIDSQRVTSMLPFNEAVVCNYLKNHQDEEITATDLCKMMKMQKSLMNRTLNSLEEKEIVKRVRSTNDKRKIIVILCDENNIYHKQHQLVLDYVEAIVENLEGLEDSIIPIFESVTKATNLIK